MTSSLYCNNKVVVVYAQQYITITQGRKVIDRFGIGEYESKKIRAIFSEVRRIADRWYLFNARLRWRLRQVRYSPVY